MSALIVYSSQYLSKLGTLTSGQQTNVTALIAAASESIEKFCKRRFALDAYEEIHPVGQFGQVFLNNYPVVTLDKVYPQQVQALTLENTSGSVTSASFDCSETALRLIHTIAGVNTVTSYLFATYPTLTLLAAAINGLGSGWVATVQGDYGPYPSHDLRADQYGQAKGATSVSMWLESTSGTLRIEKDIACLSGLYGSTDSSRYSSDGIGVWSDGSSSFGTGSQWDQLVRVQYSAGFETIPEPIQAVCGNMVANMVSSTNGGLVSESLGDYSYTISNAASDTIPLQDKQILSMYRDRRF